MPDKTQHQKIIDLNADKAWHCQNEYRALYIFSPHKRRSELEVMGYKFTPRKCQHGFRGQFDYLMTESASLNTPRAEQTDKKVFCCVENWRGQPHNKKCFKLKIAV